MSQLGWVGAIKTSSVSDKIIYPDLSTGGADIVGFCGDWPICLWNDSIWFCSRFTWNKPHTHTHAYSHQSHLLSVAFVDSKHQLFFTGFTNYPAYLKGNLRTVHLSFPPSPSEDKHWATVRLKDLLIQANIVQCIGWDSRVSFLAELPPHTGFIKWHLNQRAITAALLNRC